MIDLLRGGTSHRPLAGARPLGLVLAHPRLALAALCLLLFLPALGGHDLWNPDEPRYAEVSREMIASGDYLVPHLNGETYTHKPPLMFWAMALSSLLLGGLTETAVRLPSALAALGTVLLTFAIGRRLFGERAALVAAVALATCVKVLWQARSGQIDMLLTAFVTLTAWCWLRALDDETTTPTRWALAGFAAAGLGTLAKGPAALLPVLLAFVAYLLWDGRRGDLRRLAIGRGLLLWAAVVLAWFVPAALSAGGGYLHELLVTQNLTRYTAGADYAGTRGHLHPWWYYLQIVPVELLPASLLLPVAGLALWRDDDPERRSAVRLALAWAVVTLAFFSISPAKRSVYALQMYPAAALLVGAGVDLLARSGGWRRRWAVVPTAALAGLFAAVAVALPVLGPQVEEASLVPTWFPALLAAVVAAIAATAALAAWLWARRRPVPATLVLGAGFGLAALVAFVVAVPALDPLKSVREVAEGYVEESDEGEPYGFYPTQEASLQFYTGRTGTLLRSQREIDRFLAEPGRRWIFVERDAVDELDLPADADEAVTGANRDKGYVLFTHPGGARRTKPAPPGEP